MNISGTADEKAQVVRDIQADYDFHFRHRPVRFRQRRASRA